MNEQRSKGLESISRFLTAQVGSSRASGGRYVPRPSAVRVLALAVVAGSLLLDGISVRPQEFSKKQDKLLTQESGFLGNDVYSKLRPDPGSSDWLIYFKNPDTLKRSDTFFGGSSQSLLRS